MASGESTSATPRPGPLARGLRRALHAARNRPAAALALGPATVAARDRKRPRPVLVHQMGKVASTAVAETIAQATDRPVYHTHVLSRGGIRFATNAYRSNWNVSGLPWHVFEAVHVRRMLRRHQPWDVITVVRDPVAKNVSSFFQTATLQHHLDPASLTVEELQKHFLDTYDEHDRPLNWLDTEVDAVFGTDVFGETFPHEQGWQLIETPAARVAIVRYEDLARAAVPAIEALLGVQVGELVAANVTADKAYGSNQSALIDALTLPTEYLDMMYRSKYATHFYKPAERAEMRARWA